MSSFANSSAHATSPTALGCSAQDMLKGGLLDTIAEACTNFLSANWVAGTLTTDDLERRVMELTESIDDDLVGRGVSLKDAMSSDANVIEVVLETVRDSEGHPFTKAWAKVSLEVAGQKIQYALDFHSPLSAQPSIGPQSSQDGSSSDVLSPLTVAGPVTEALGPDRDQRDTGHEITLARDTGLGTSWGKLVSSRHIVYDPEMVSRQLRSGPDGVWASHLRMTCYACVLKALQERLSLSPLDLADEREGDYEGPRTTVLTRWMSSPSRKKVINSAVVNFRSTVWHSKACLPGMSAFYAEPQGSWETEEGSPPDDGSCLKRQCKLWTATDPEGAPTTGRPGKALTTTSNLMIEVSDIPGLLDPLLRARRKRAPRIG